MARRLVRRTRRSPPPDWAEWYRAARTVEVAVRVVLLVALLAAACSGAPRRGTGASPTPTEDGALILVDDGESVGEEG